MGSISIIGAFTQGVMAAAVLLCSMLGIVYARTFGIKETNKMIVGWAIAYGQTFLIVEPVQIFLLAGAPCLFDDSHRCGRCMNRCRTIYNELLSP
jgi:hypothetical protein